MIPISFWCFILLLLLTKVIAVDVTQPSSVTDTTSDEKERLFSDSSYQPHSRQKRLIWVTDDGRLALPPGTSLVIAPTLAMPFVRYPPDGFHSNLSISIPLTSEFVCSFFCSCRVENYTSFFVLLTHFLVLSSLSLFHRATHS